MIYMFISFGIVLLIVWLLWVAAKKFEEWLTQHRLEQINREEKDNGEDTM